MGHACEKNLMKTKSSVDAMEFSGNVIGECVVCTQGKQTRASFRVKGNRSTKSFGCARCLLAFVDDFSRKVFVHPMKQKSEVLGFFVDFKRMVKTSEIRQSKRCAQIAVLNS